MDKTFGIIPASGASLITLMVIGVFLLLFPGLFTFIRYSARNTKFEVSDEGLLFITDRSNVVYIPTNQGYSVLLSVSSS